MTSLFRNTEILSFLPSFKLHNEVRTNRLFHSTCLKPFQDHHETFLNKSKQNNTDTAFKIAKQKAFESAEFLKPR